MCQKNLQIPKLVRKKNEIGISLQTKNQFDHQKKI